MPSMKGITKFLTVASWLISVNALPQTNQEKPVETNAFDIANNPVQFKGKLVLSFPLSQMVDCFAMPQGAPTLLVEKLEAVAIDIEAIERLIASEPLDTSDQLLALRTIQELYRRLADDLRVAISLFE